MAKILEMPGIEPGASRMQSERSTTELHPLTEGLIPIASSHRAIHTYIHTYIHAYLLSPYSPCRLHQDGKPSDKTVRQPGFEPGSHAWEACMIPLHY